MERKTEEETIGICRDNLAGCKKPKFVRFVDGLPRNNMGNKVLKYMLKEQHFTKGGGRGVPRS
jgi:acyl-coenzyme A synthetase/AMP-(fatty) acid ligase